MRWCRVAAALLALWPHVRGVTFDIPSTESRCIFDQLGKDTLCTGEFSVGSREGGAHKGHVRVNVQVTDPSGHEVFAQHGTNGGKFGFTADRSGNYKVCFDNKDMVEHRVTIKLRSGVEAKDLTEIVQREHLKPLSAEILRIEETVRNIREELLLLKHREAEMRKTNDSINSRVTYFSLFSVGVVSSLGLWQVLHLKSYFMEKKLI